ncbi:hypothetical protein [Rhizobium sp. 9140]|uniref:hypothetical protein n=1 Tax=Rhizobium sp. 9140 TaxID=1761900 RepID=UPI0007994512|nr:hypothetical protein [Rhizobium sp. 9140]CZT38073.1 hypothetical protein GA0004734_00049480 [Rhizobium sp. 9140]
MMITYDVYSRALSAHSDPGSSQDFFRHQSNFESDIAVGAALVITPASALHVRIGPTDPDSIAIRIPAGTTVTDLAIAMWFYPLPALMLQILRLARARDIGLNDQEQELVQVCERAFLDCLVRRDWVKRLAEHILASPAWRARRSEGGPPN